MSEANVNKKRKNRWAFPLGLVITVFAVIGLVCVILAGVNATKKAVIKSKNIDEYNTMLTPVVMTTPTRLTTSQRQIKISLSTFPFGLF